MLCEHDVIFQVQNYIQFMCEYTCLISTTLTGYYSILLDGMYQHIHWGMQILAREGTNIE